MINGTRVKVLYTDELAKYDIHIIGLEGIVINNYDNEVIYVMLENGEKAIFGVNELEVIE